LGDEQRQQQQDRRASDRTSVKALGWMACLMLSGSLIYTFVRSAKDGTQDVDPWFFGAQTLASTLFLVYSLKLKNRVFVTANAVAIASAAGTLLLKLF
jgi:lipid-A-disaccharide synthase-like uncharacterized protein